MGNTSSKEEVKLGESIGRGMYAEVFKAQWNGRTVAAKKLHRYLIGKRNVVKMFQEEWETLSKLDHPNIVRYYTVVLPRTPDDTATIITELLECDLREVIHRARHGHGTKHTVPFAHTISIMMDVASGLQYLHSLKIVHRDLASKNILMTSDNRAKIADLGFSKVFPHGAMQATADPGTPANRAPETFAENLWRKKIEYDASVDVFSFGTVLLEVIVGHPPEHLSEPKRQDGQIIPEHVRRSADIMEMGTDHPLRVLVLACLNNVPKERPSAELILQQLRVFKHDNDVMRSQDQLVHAHSSLSVHRVASTHYDHKFKVMIVGGSSVGKTSIVKRFVDPSSPLITRPVTLDFADHFERLQMKGKSILLQLTDTSGEARIHSIMPQMYRGTSGVVLVFDVSDWNTLVEVRNWILMIKERCGQIPMVLVGNKTDLRDRQVDTRTAQEFSEEHDMSLYFEVSAKTGVNIDETFSALTECLIEEEEKRPSRHRNASGWSEDVFEAYTQSKEPPAITEREKVSPILVSKDPDSIVLGQTSIQNVPSSRSGCPCTLT